MIFRLGILGFLNLDDDVIAGNMGLKDQVVALKWVKDHIEKFGGNPNKVTIFGMLIYTSNVIRTVNINFLQANLLEASQ